MKIISYSIFVNNQTHASDVYTRLLGFTKKHDIPLGEHRWLTMVDDSNGVEVILEPSEHAAVKAFQKALRKDGIPAAMFGVDDIAAEHSRLTALGFVFTMPPTDLGTVKIAVFDDTCGNLIQLAQR